MRELIRTCLVCLLIVALVDLPALSAPAKPLGVVIQAQSAQVADVAGAGGTTVYAGDSLATDTGGSLRLRIGPAQLYLLSASAATLAEDPAGASATLTRGTAGFSSPGGAGIELRTELATIRAKSAQSTHARVTIVSPNELLVSSFRGPVEVETEGQTYALAEGNTYRLVADPKEPDPPDVRSARRRPKVKLFLLGVIGAGAGVGAWLIHEAVESPTKPEN